MWRGRPKRHVYPVLRIDPDNLAVDSDIFANGLDGIDIPIVLPPSGRSLRRRSASCTTTGPLNFSLTVRTRPNRTGEPRRSRFEAGAVARAAGHAASAGRGI
jgi:hypothetical protein